MKMIKKMLGARAAAPEGAGMTSDRGSGAPPRARELQALRSRLFAMQSAALDERRRAAALRRRLDGLEKEKASVNAIDRLNGSDSAEVVRILAERIEAAGRQIKDADSTAAELEVMHQAAQAQLVPAERAARHELGAALDGAFAQAAQAYNALAVQTAAAALDLLALQELMIQRGAGNSNGFDGGVSLPQARPGDGRTLEPILRGGDPAFMGRVMRRRDEIADRLRADGFEL